MMKIPCVGLALLAVGLLGFTTSADAQTISLASNQTFEVGDPSSPVGEVRIADSGTPQITRAGDVRVRIPSAFNGTWDTSVGVVSIGGSATDKVSEAVRYEDGGRTMVLDVTADFEANDEITISGARLTDFTDASRANRLELIVGSNGQVTGTTDEDMRVLRGGSADLAIHLMWGGKRQHFESVDVSHLYEWEEL